MGSTPESRKRDSTYLSNVIPDHFGWLCLLECWWDVDDMKMLQNLLKPALLYVLLFVCDVEGGRDLETEKRGDGRSRRKCPSLRFSRWGSEE